MIPIKQQLVSNRSKTYGNSNPCNYITIHETANYNKGAGAQVHANLQSNGFTASWHYQVDDKAIIQSYPDTSQCWHAGDNRGPGNMQSIGIEICVNPDSDFKKAVANAADLVRYIMKKHNIPIGNVVQHNQWSGKNCPSNLRNGSKGIDWNGFINLVKTDPVKASAVEEVDKVEEINSLKKINEKLEKRIEVLEKKVNVESDPVSGWANEEWKEACENGYYDRSRPRSYSRREEDAKVLNKLRHNFLAIFKEQEDRIGALEIEIAELKNKNVI